MLNCVVNQKYRKMCASAIKEKYEEPSELRAERRQGKYYYAVWGIGTHILETVVDRTEIRIYEYVPVA